MTPRDEGMIAFESGRTTISNPYFPFTSEWHEWNDGYDYAQFMEEMN